MYAANLTVIFIIRFTIMLIIEPFNVKLKLKFYSFYLVTCSSRSLTTVTELQ